MAKAIYQTRYGRPIEEGQRYAAVLDDNTVLMTVASSNTKNNPKIIERFLNKIGAKQFLAKKGINNPVFIEEKALIVEKEVIKVETEKEKLAELSKFEQLDKVNSEEDFKAWLTRNKLKVNKEYNLLVINFSNNHSLISFGFSLTKLPHCCGGYELGEHMGLISQSEVKYINEKRLETLCKYIVDDFDELIEQSHSNFSIISYVKNPNNISEPSARIGFLHRASKYFREVYSFQNPKTENNLVLYTVNDDWFTNEDD